MKEKDVLHQVGQMLDLNGWEWWHVPAPMIAGRDGNWHPARKAKGLPDIFALHRDPVRMLIMELKGKGGKLSEEQRRFLMLARDVSEEHFKLCQSIEPKRIGVYVVEPTNLDAIEQIIRTRVLT